MWNWIKGLFGVAPAPDLRVDPEDPMAYAHVDLVQAEFEEKGEVFQILRDGGKPSDVAQTSKVSSLSGFSYWVDVYEGPKGKGYVINYETLKDGKTIRKAANFGPEEWREQDWTEVNVGKV